MPETTEYDTEAGSYIEDDPEAWVTWMTLFSEYAPQYSAMVAHLGSEDGAAEVLAGTMLNRLAGQYGLFLVRSELPVSGESEGLRDLFASGNYLQLYDHRQNRWLSPDESLAALTRSSEALTEPEAEDGA